MEPDAPTFATDPTPDPSPDSPAATEAVPSPAVDDGRMIGGVCVLLADRLGFDVLWVRIAFVLLALTGGIGVLVYAGLWLVLVAAPISEWRWVRYVGGLLIALGIPLALNAGSYRFITGELAVVLLLLGLMLALWNPRRSTARLARPAPSPAIDPVQLAPPPEAPWTPEPPGGGRPTASWRRAPRPPRARSPLGRAVFGLAVVVAAVGALIDQSNGGRLHPEQWLGAAALVCGLGLLVGTVRGRARWLFLPALAFAAVGLGWGELARMRIGLDEAGTDQYLYVSTLNEGGSWRARTATGSVYVQIEAAPKRQLTIDARTVLGDIRVESASDVTVRVISRVDHGDRYSSSGTIDGDVVIGPKGRPDVIINAWTAWGDVWVDPYSLPPEPPLPVVTMPVSVTPPPSELDEPADPGLGAVTVIDQWVSATSDGWILLAGGEAVIDPDDNIVTGNAFAIGEDDVTGTTVAGRASEYSIMTSLGEYRLLPRSLLIAPDGTVFDLEDVRRGVAEPETVAPQTVSPPQTVPLQTEPQPLQTVPQIGSEAP